MTGAVPGRALILGVGGQDGFYLTRELLSLGWQVIGVARSPRSLPRLPDHPRARYEACDLVDEAHLRRVIDNIEFDHVYNLMGYSSVADSWANPELSHAVNSKLACRTMAMVHAKITATRRDIRLFQASSAEMFGDCGRQRHSESTPMKPVSPYGKAKLSAHQAARAYRLDFGHHFVGGILNSHESPLRPSRFVTRKISRATAAIIRGQGSVTRLGNVDAVRDWGHASDYVSAMVLMMTAAIPDDYVIGSGTGRSVSELVGAFLACAGVDDTEKWFTANEEAVRPADASTLVGDARRIRFELGWQPQISFQHMLEEMLSHDLTTSAAN